VGDQDHREPLLAETLDQLEHLAHLRDAQRGGRLVADHHAEFHMEDLLAREGASCPRQNPPGLHRAIGLLGECLGAERRARIATRGLKRGCG
jgi:hypothetical protein